MKFSWLLLLMPFATALIGWFTNFIAVKMLFYPREEKKFLFFKIHGIFPKRQQEIANKLGKVVSEELLSAADIRTRISGPESIEELTKNIEEHIEQYLTEVFPEKHPVASVFVGKRLKGRIKTEFIDEVKLIAPQVIGNYISKVEEDLDIENMIRSKIKSLDPEHLEKLLMQVLKKEFRFIELIGAIIGFIIGIFQLVIWWVSS